MITRQDFSISSTRTIWMGIAILMVMLYHMTGMPHVEWYLSSFNEWYFGVDIFMLISGFGLCRSYENYSLKDFYLRRFKRIFPLYFLQLVVLHLFFFHNDNIVDIVGECTTLVYWGIGEGYNNWYVNAIVLLYLCFPFFYELCRRFPIKTYSFICFLSFILLFGHWTWQVQALISRLPIYVFGIVLYTINYKKNSNKILYTCLLISLLLWNTTVGYHRVVYIYAASICPIVFGIINPVLSKYTKGYFISKEKTQMGRVIDFCLSFIIFLGIHSYELYLSDYIAEKTMLKIISYYPFLIHSYFIIGASIILRVFWGSIFIFVQKMINRIIC